MAYMIFILIITGSIIFITNNNKTKKYDNKKAFIIICMCVCALVIMAGIDLLNLQIELKNERQGEKNINGFQSGKRNGYIYGYIFFSGNKGLVLDEGPNEYLIDSAELLINGEFVLMENLTVDLLKSKEGLYGAQARIKSNLYL